MIVIVEDDEICRRALQVLFAGRGYRCYGAGSAEEALGLLEKYPRPEMVLIDIDLPGMNGLDLVRVLRQEYPGVECMLMSANDHEPLCRQKAAEVPFFPKPLNVSKLLSAVATA